MEVQIPREIKDYKEKFILNFTLRQTLSVATGLIIGVPLFLYGSFKLGINTDLMGWIAIIFGIFIFGMGFFNYRNMTLEVFLYHIIKNYFIYPQKRLYSPELIGGNNIGNDKSNNRKKKKRKK